jgi:hypothetical protein
VGNYLRKKVHGPEHNIRPAGRRAAVLCHFSKENPVFLELMCLLKECNPNARDPDAESGDWANNGNVPKIRNYSFLLRVRVRDPKR